MASIFYPLLFRPVYKSFIWGGNRIRNHFPEKPAPDGTCAESWEISDRPEGPSVVSNGPFAGASLPELVAKHGSDIVGSSHTGSGFPLLVKLIDAKQRLSVQVHPDENTAKMHGGEPKTEMWYVLGAEPGACIFAGLTGGTTKTGFAAALDTGKVEALLGSLPARKGEAIFVPGGRIHAIGEGCLLLEIQQSSNTTYRVYDWGRVDKDGKPRELHVDKALAVINWHDSTPESVKPARISTANGNTLWEVLKNPLFHITRLDMTASQKAANDGRSFHIIFVESGKVEISGGGVAAMAPAGTSCLLPAAVSEYSMDPCGNQPASLVITRLV